MHQCQDRLFPLLQGLAALIPVKYLDWPTCASSDSIQDFLLKQLIFSDHFRLYPPAANYQRSFWKWVIAQVENGGEEVREEIYTHYLTLLDYSQTELVSLTQPPPPSYVTYMWKDLSDPTEPEPRMAIKGYRKVTLFESRTTIESGTTGLRTWSASFALADYFISHRQALASLSVLELGSGTGFLGTIIAQVQLEALNQKSNSVIQFETQPSLCLTDLDEQVLARCESNVKLPCNNVLSHPKLYFRILDWNDALDERRRTSVSAFLKELGTDLILGADLVYDISIIPALVTMLRLALTVDSTSPSKRAIIAATLRNEFTLYAFIQSVREAELLLEEETVGQDGFASHFGHSQPDLVEGRNHVFTKLTKDRFKYTRQNTSL